MKFYINEENKYEDLFYMKENDRGEWKELTNDVIEDCNNDIKFDQELDAYRIPRETFDFWKDYFEGLEKSDATQKELGAIYGDEAVATIYGEEYRDAFGPADHAIVWELAEKRCREELEPIAIAE